MKLEVIATSIADVKAISQSQADRIEYCHTMVDGGLTPKIKEVKQALLLPDHQPINVMIRPNAKSFAYSWLAYQRMKWSVYQFAKTDVNGFVLGILKKGSNEIDEKRLKKLVKIAQKQNKELVFHRAIDQVPSYSQALDTLKSLGFKTILTTGGHQAITKNFTTLDQLQKMHKVIILAGGGVNQDNAKEVSLHVDELHVGSSVRVNGWDSSIDIEKINQIKKLIEKG
ncbi:copper homeostasis protein CutC [Mesoplasma whartonense]|uniref:copper homeostasis protein CutC n=1 Tax=Mesoplasma whartonense TaxID=2878854 RepID=UPI002022A71F|nr:MULTISPECIES: copper homeostasis protein CutC [unclassified Mesoplasma]MCL8212787.1 Copper homeostasis protein CutC [Mesoplasma sp. JKS002661]MCL8215788.1 Copper homeostasis protein CutC [Mesoplasma sp. JKS002657]